MKDNQETLDEKNISFRIVLGPQKCLNYGTNLISNFLDPLKV